MQLERRAIISNVIALFILVFMKIAKFYFVAFLCLINNVSLAQLSSFEDESSTSLGDINYTAWLLPNKAGKIFYGVSGWQSRIQLQFIIPMKKS